MGHGAEALQTLAESSRLDEQIGRLGGRSHRLVVSALAHLAREERVLATSALGGYDAHPSGFVIGTFGRVSEQIGWLDRAAVAAMGARLDPARWPRPPPWHAPDPSRNSSTS